MIHTSGRELLFLLLLRKDLYNGGDNADLHSTIGTCLWLSLRLRITWARRMLACPSIFFWGEYVVLVFESMTHTAFLLT